MSVNVQNPGVQAGVSRFRNGKLTQPEPTLSDWRAQAIASRFSLSPWMAREVSRLCFGEGCND